MLLKPFKDLDIGLNPIDDKLLQRLLLANLLVFIIVLAVFCAAVYAFSVGAAYVHLREKLAVFGGSAIGSIDSGETVPDLVRDTSTELGPASLRELKLEWFGTDGKLVAERGALKVTAPFSKDANFQEQASPHALIFTKPGVVGGVLIGYVRVAQSLSDVDREAERLLWGLALGTLAALAASSLGILWLTKQLLKPIDRNFLRLKQFTDDASHELRNPLMSIKSASSVISKHSRAIEPEHREQLSIIMDSTNDMTRIVDELLLLAEAGGRIAANQPELLTVDVCALVAEIVRSVSTCAEEKNIQLSVSNGGAAEVQGDREGLRRMITNILQNAILYTLPNGKVSVDVFQDRNTVSVRVQDNGIGVSDVDLPKIFDRFWRADRARSHRTGGSGLGLAIAKAVAEQHGGNITVSSKLAEGSCFVIILPKNVGKPGQGV